MFIVKGYAFYHNKQDEIIKVKLFDIVAEPLKVNNYEEGHKCFDNVPYYMFLLSPIKEVKENE